jgi:hypothetical protein
MNRPTRVAWIVAGLSCLAVNSVCADWQVWTVTETRRVLREDPAEKPTAVGLACARNEWRGFQILVRSKMALRGIRIEAGDLVGPGGAVLASSQSRLFRQHQFHLTAPSYRNSFFRPGWYPDALIPASHPMTGHPLSAARFVAMPFDLPADQTHGFWVDLYVPAGTKAGDYRGTYRVRSAEGLTAKIPVDLTVWDFALPQTPTLKTEFGSPSHSLISYYKNRSKAGKGKKLGDEDAAFLQVSQLLSEHRFNATPRVGLTPQAQPDGTFRIPSEQIRALREFVDRFHVNAVATPHPSQAVRDPEAESKQLKAWLAAWDRAAVELDRPNVHFYTYLLDEPNDEKAYSYVQKWGRAIRQFKSALKVMVVEQTLTQDPKWGNLNGATDIWCPLFCLHDEATAAQRRALGETVWTYTALCQGEKMSPWWQTDFPLLNYRVPSWIAWRYRMQGLLYWGSMSVWSFVDDPWTEPGTYDLRKRENGPLFNGEGSLLYPARDVGYEGVVSSMRLKALRDSIEDYEYLAILDRLGRADEAQKIVQPLAESFFQWNPDPKTYDEVRVRLAAMIVAAKK